MQQDNYSLSTTDPSTHRTAILWLLLGLFALIAAGLYSILLVLARTPLVQQWIPFIDFFRTALVVHVNLSVFIWLLAFSAVMWSMSARQPFRSWDSASVIMAVIGLMVIILSPFSGAGQPLLNNYMPVLQHPVYYTGLGLFALGVVSQLIRAIISVCMNRQRLDGGEVIKYGVVLSAAVTAAAFLAFIASYAGLDRQLQGQVYFEFLFWGTGHVMQFAYTLMMMVCWVLLASNSQCRYVLSPRVTLLFFIFLALPVITVPFLYLAHTIVTPGHRLAFTELMKYGGLSCLPLGFAILISLWGVKPVGNQGKYLRAALNMSVLLFAVGGVLGFLITGLDIVIPAHYHGSTVAVTIAFMGITYYLLPQLGFALPPPRLTLWQPYIYGTGQLMHISGLAITGGYGVQRKTAGMAQGVDRLGEIAGMGLMGLGGLVSVIGGLLFLVIAIKSMLGHNSETLQSTPPETPPNLP